jgi:hypothetical protein
MPTPVRPTCPPAPAALADAASAVVTNQDATETLGRDLDVSSENSARYRRLALEYAERLAEVTRSEEWLRETMRGYGRYLHQHRVQPEHIVICVRESMEHARFKQYAGQHRVVERCIGWTIEGYYAERAAQSPEGSS